MSKRVSIPIIYDELELDRTPGEKGIFTASMTQARIIGELEVEPLADTLKQFCSTIGHAFQGVTTAIDDFELRTFELNVDVTAKGEVRLIGSLGTEVKGGIKLTFQRKPES